MPSINFPTSPALNDEYSFEGKTWIYNGTAWVLKSSPTTVRLDAAFSKANDAYNLANTANINANIAISTANIAFNVANGLAANVQYAWNAANTANGNILTGDYKAVAKLSMDYSSGNFYFPSHYADVNPDIYVTSGESLAIDLYTGGSPFVIRYTANGEFYNIGLTHVATDGTISLSGAAQGKTSGTLFIDARVDQAGNSIVYHSGYANTNQTGNIIFGYPSPVFQENVNATIQDIYDVANNAAAGADTWGRTHSNAAFNQANTANQNAASASSYANSAFAKANTANTLAQAAFDAANNATDTWVRNAANAASSYANGAFLAANTADQKAVSAGSYANSAFAVANIAYGWGNHANAGYATQTFVNTAISNVINTAPSTLDTLNELAAALNNDPSFATTITTMVGDAKVRTNAAFDVANSASSYANGAFVAANTADQKAISAGSYANSAFSKSNTANVLAQAAFDAANNATDTWVRQAANSASSYANGAFAAANTADQKAVTAGDYANSAFAVANNATDTWVRQAANSASSYANSAFNVANTANGQSITSGSYANSAYIHANAAFAAANSAVSGTIDVYARNHANAAFDKANTAPTPVSGIFDYGLVTEVTSYTAYDYGTL